MEGLRQLLAQCNLSDLGDIYRIGGNHSFGTGCGAPVCWDVFAYLLLWVLGCVLWGFLPEYGTSWVRGRAWLIKQQQVFVPGEILCWCFNYSISFLFIETVFFLLLLCIASSKSKKKTVPPPCLFSGKIRSEFSPFHHHANNITAWKVHHRPMQRRGSKLAEQRRAADYCQGSREELQTI